MAKFSQNLYIFLSVTLHYRNKAEMTEQKLLSKAD